MKKRMTVSLEFARFLWSTSSAVTYAFRACAVALDIFDDELDKLEQGRRTWTLVVMESDFVAERGSCFRVYSRRKAHRIISLVLV